MYKPDIIGRKVLKGYDVTLSRTYDNKFMIIVKKDDYRTFDGRANFIGDGNRLYNKVLRDIHHGVFQEV